MFLQNELKKTVALAVLEYIPVGCTLGVGTGSTINYFIDALPAVRGKIDAVVASSNATAARLKKNGFPVYDLNSVGDVTLYIDSADEFNHHRYLIKGGGGALTGEKILAAVAKKFICIVDVSKQVSILGKFPLPVEVIPMARGYVARALTRMGGTPIYRPGFVTDYGNIILDVEHLDMVQPVLLEEQLNQITGVVTNGLFASRAADEILLSTQQGIQVL